MVRWVLEKVGIRHTHVRNKERAGAVQGAVAAAGGWATETTRLILTFFSMRSSIHIETCTRKHRAML